MAVFANCFLHKDKNFILVRFFIDYIYFAKLSKAYSYSRAFLPRFVMSILGLIININALYKAYF